MHSLTDSVLPARQYCYLLLFKDMLMTDLLESLNPPQRQAVQHTQGPLLLLSGAGSGKTRVITYRIAHLVRHHQVSPLNILAVTFTNKSAGEMTSRLDHLVGKHITNLLWVATFHATCARILRRDIEHLGYSRSFTIYDTADQLMLIKEILKALQVREETNNPKAILSRISEAKNDFVTPERFADNAEGYFEENVAKIYPAYQTYLRQNNSLDFDDLIMLTVELFGACPDVLEYYQTKFRHVLVDEYQDTNRSQYLLVNALAKKHHNICVVGDDDQSIYSWRGADINNILDFENDYPGTTVLRLEQNYRSTQTILEAAYELVRNNRQRKEKKLWTQNEIGEKITCYEAKDEHDEAGYVVQQIFKWQAGGMKYGDCVIFYRINAQSRAFEDALTRANIPYQIVGGVRFYERMEIKDVIAYLRVIVNPNDAISLRRIINVPRRGIGSITLENIEDFARRNQISLYDALKRTDEIHTLREGVKEKIRGFTQLLGVLHTQRPVEETIRELLHLSGYLKALEREETDEGQNRLENISELITAAVEYETHDSAPTLSGFLETITLAGDVDTINDKSNVLTLMTLHSAKGLEFPIVFMGGVEEGSLPHQRSFSSEVELEEERRLCYVGLTRAKKHVYLLHARMRRIFGNLDYRMPSRFIEEIPSRLINQETNTNQETDYESVRGPAVKSYDPDEPDFDDGNTFDFSIGEIVFHPRFGRGKITGLSGYGPSSRLRIRFARGVEKTLVAEYARLQAMEA